EQEDLPFGGGSGGGVSITPIAFLIVSTKGIKMVHLDGTTHLVEKLMDFAPQVVEKIQQMLKESESGKNKGEKAKGKDSQQGSETDSSIYDICYMFLLLIFFQAC